MGASAWDYYVPYQADLNAALIELWQRTFANGEYLWPYEFYRGIVEDKPRPATPEELFADEMVQECGTHSILDMYTVVDPGEEPDYGTVRPLTVAEVRTHLGGPRPSRSTFEQAFDKGGGAIANLGPRWHGFCTVLYSDDGDPNEIAFWGYSGD